jgi:hypothetical protein
LEHECNQLRIRNDTLIQQASQLQNEKVNMQQEKNNVISELKGELKMKCFEYTTLGVTFEVLYHLLVSYGVHYRILLCAVLCLVFRNEWASFAKQKWS